MEVAVGVFEIDGKAIAERCDGVFVILGACRGIVNDEFFAKEIGVELFHEAPCEYLSYNCITQRMVCTRLAHFCVVCKVFVSNKRFVLRCLIVRTGLLGRL